MAYGFDVLTLPEVLATTDDANKASIRLLTRLGALPAPRVQIGPTPSPASASAPHTDPGMLLPGPCSSMDRATDF
jgi:RimJ/RimL family protein N-acetyltransferase